MREIKFRAWDKVANKFRGLNGVQDLFSVRSDGYCHEDYILNQYTGMKDKNGVEIYEGDIVEYTNGTYRPYPNHEHIPKISTHPVIIEDWLYCNISTMHLVTHCLKVIGNIYQNPELIESMKQAGKP